MLIMRIKKGKATGRNVIAEADWKKQDKTADRNIIMFYEVNLNILVKRNYYADTQKRRLNHICKLPWNYSISTLQSYATDQLME